MTVEAVKNLTLSVNGKLVKTKYLNKYWDVTFYLSNNPIIIQRWKDVNIRIKMGFAPEKIENGAKIGLKLIK